MTPEDLKEHLRKKPFVPFRITLTDGSTHDVRHPELCMVGRRSVEIGVGVKENDPDLLFDRIVHADVFHVVKVEPLAPGSTNLNGPS